MHLTVAVYEAVTDRRRRGRRRASRTVPAAASENGIALLFALVTGVGSQHSADNPAAGFGESRLIALLDPALDMYAAYFSPECPPAWTPWSSHDPRRAN